MRPPSPSPPPPPPVNRVDAKETVIFASTTTTSYKIPNFHSCRKFIYITCDCLCCVELLVGLVGVVGATENCFTKYSVGLCVG